MARALGCGICLWLLAGGTGAAAALPPELCEPLVAVRWLQREAEVPAADDWRSGGSADRLRGDECGHVWGLWFNSWVLHAHGEARLIGHLQIPYEGALASLASGGVADFVAEAGALWVLGRNGEFARRDRGGWHRLTAPQPCRNGRLARAGDSLWLSCDQAPGQHLLARWLRGPERWRIERLAPGLRPLLLSATPERVYAIGPSASAIIDADRIGLAQAGKLPVLPLAGAIDAGRLALAGEQGLWLQDRASGRWQEHLPGQAITGLAFDAQGSLWAAVRDDGVRVLVDGEWLYWRYAQGLSDAEARDLFVDGAGRLWLAGTPGAVIDARAAARRMRALALPSAVPARVHKDACVAARAELGAPPAGSGQVVHVDLRGQDLVFFEEVQVCPDPWRGPRETALHVRRVSDGAILELARNGRRGYLDCGEPCVEPSRSRLLAEWGIAIHRPEPDGWRPEPLRVPQPLPAQSPGWVALLGAGDEVVLSSQGGALYRHDASGWSVHPPGTLLARDNPALAIAQAADGSIWLGSSPSWSREQARYSGTPLHRWRHGRWRDLVVGADGGAWAVWDILALAEGVLLAGNGGVRRVQRDGSEVQGFLALDSVPTQALAVDRDGQFWALHALGHPGLSVQVDGRWRRLSSREGLLADHWKALAFDAQDRAWLLAEDGRVAIYARTALLAGALP